MQEGAAGFSLPLVLRQKAIDQKPSEARPWVEPRLAGSPASPCEDV